MCKVKSSPLPGEETHVIFLALWERTHLQRAGDTEARYKFCTSPEDTQFKALNN